MAYAKVTLTIFVFSCAFLLTAGLKNAVINLDETNWTDMLNGEWMVEFYAPWCPACKALESVWKDFGTWSEDLSIKVAKVDVTVSPGLSGRFMVTALPTIFHVLNGEFRQYKGSRDKDTFISFIEDKKWKLVEPVPSWKSPASIQMSIVSGFFRLSQILRQIHTQLMEDFGLPTWGSYLIFAVGTIFLGALLGFLLVCCIDLIYPPKTTGKVNDIKSKVDKKADKNSGDELADEDIKDDLIDDQEKDENNSQSDSEVKEKAGSNPNSPVVKKRKPRKE
nr:thioredoxin-related transmembrane protein 1-like [Onthophagus taurus]